VINLLIGPPGGGKSYEAVVYHILPALSRGRKVITNLPLDMERIAAIDAAFPALVETRLKTLAVEDPVCEVPGRFNKQAECNARAFSNPEDYGDAWRDPTSGAGPLYVIDECHLALPRNETLRAVEEWYSLHRHESADVLLITQSYGKVSKSVVDLVQVCYRVKKGTAFGRANNYIRKVQDGVRGEVVNTSIRKYDKRYFGLYKSHTRGGGEELAAEDIVPIWKRWPFIGAGIMIPLAALIFFAGGSPNILKPKAAQAVVRAVPAPVAAVPVEGKGVAPVEVVKAQETAAHPYSGRTLHVLGSLISAKGKNYLFAVAQNGQRVSDVTSVELEVLGYTVEGSTDCAVKVGHGAWSNWIICDSPQVGLAPAKGDGVQAGSRQG